MLKTVIKIFEGIGSICKGLMVTGKNMFRKPVTLQYPLERALMTERFRGMVDLHPEKCIACSQCIKICPTAALDLTAEPDPETKKRALKTFHLNEEICCFCGLCEEVCPTQAIFLNKCYEGAYYKRDDFTAIDLMAKDKYDRWEPLKAKKGH